MTPVQWFETKHRYTIGSWILRLGVKVMPCPVDVTLPEADPAEYYCCPICAKADDYQFKVPRVADDRVTEDDFDPDHLYH